MRPTSDTLGFATPSGVRLPNDPGPPERFARDDARHWFPYEYAPWIAAPKGAPRRSATMHAKGPRRVTFLVPGEHPYFDVYLDHVRSEAAAQPLDVSIHARGWDPEEHLEGVREIIGERPDLVVYVANEIELAHVALSRFSEKEIPVLASNMPPTSDTLRYTIGWTGPDSWAQSRALARRFADALDKVGGYAVIGHIEGTTETLARTWGVVTELTSYAPQMRCLAVEPGIFNTGTMRRVVRRLIDRYGPELKGIVSSDDSIIQQGLVQALRDRGRLDITSVAHGSTSVGLDFIEEGTLEAITYQSARADATLALRTAVDWLHGLDIEATRFLPVHIIDRSNVTAFFDRVDRIDWPNMETLEAGILSGHEEDISSFYGELERRLTSTAVPSPVDVRAKALEIAIRLSVTARGRDIAVTEAIGGYREAVERLHRSGEAAAAIEWLRERSVSLCRRLNAPPAHAKPIPEQLVQIVKGRYGEPLSLKSLSHELSLSAAYLGRVFHEYTGESFSAYLGRYRIARAVELLKRGDESARQIAERVGFSDANYFYLVFKRVMGRTVTQYIDAP